MANIISTVTNGKTLILTVGSDPSTLSGTIAPIGSVANAIDGSGTYYKSSTLNTGWHKLVQADNLSSPNILIVNKNPIQGQYLTIESAINAIVAPSSTNRWLILVGVGQFAENTLVLPSYTSIVGASIQETQVFPLTITQHMFELGTYNEISFMWIEGVGTGYSAIHVNDKGSYSQAHKITFIDCDTNVLITSVTQDTYFFGEYLDFNGIYSYGLRVIASNGFTASANIENYYNLPSVGVSCIGTHATGVGARVNVLAAGNIGDGLGTAFYAQNGAVLEITSTNIDGFNKGIHIGNVGTASRILANSVVSTNNTTYDIQIEHPSATGTIGGMFNDNKIATASSLVGLLVQNTNDGGLTITNKINLLFPDATKTDISTVIIKTSTMGVEKGGSLTDGGGFVVNVGSGYGYYEVFPTNDIIKRLSWVGSSITLSANVDLYIYLNNNGILSSSGAEPDTRYNILLGRVATNATAIEFICDAPSNAEHTSNLLSNNFKNAIGSVYANGSIVSANITPLHLNVGAGRYYYGENVFNPSGGTGITFTSIYGQGSGVISGQVSVSNTQYDITGTLTALSASYYAKGSIYLVGQGIYEKYYFVYPENQYNTLLAVQQANIPLPPSSFRGSVVLIASIIVQQGNPSIVQIIDQRPVVGFKSSGVNASADHLSLLNINGGINGDGGHTNMFTVNGSKAMTGNLNMSTNNIINSGTINGITIQAHESRHLPNGPDPLTTAAPIVNISGSSLNSVGIQNSFSRSDHSHEITGTSLTKTNDTNVTLTLGGSPTTALLNPISLNLGWSGLLSEARGGTNHSTYAVGDILYSSSVNTLSRLPVGTSGQVFTVVSGLPAWVTNSITGTGSVVYATSPTLITPILGVASGTSLSLNTFLELAEQSAPSIPTNAIRIFTDNLNRLSWIGETGYVRTIDASLNTANRSYVLQDKNGTIAHLDDITGASNLPLTDVISQLNTPPAHVSGERYLINTAPTGAWVGLANNTVQSDGTTWTPTSPIINNTVYLTSTAQTLKYNGTTWVLGGATPVLQNGNSFGTGVPLSIGTNDASDVNIKRNGVLKAQVTSTGFAIRNTLNTFNAELQSTAISNITLALPLVSSTIVGQSIAGPQYRVPYYDANGLLTNSAAITYVTTNGSMINTFAQNGTTAFNCVNSSTGVASTSQYNLNNGSYNYSFKLYGNSFTTNGLIKPHLSSLQTNGTGGMLFASTSIGSEIQFATGGTTAANLVATLNSNGFNLETVGMGFKIKEGTNACMGLATLVGGTITVSNTKVTANSRIFPAGQTASLNVGNYHISSRVPGVSFTITSSNALDTNAVAWEIKEPI